jgi:ceramide glucosyltransferase
MPPLAVAAALFSGAGLVQAALGVHAIRRFQTRGAAPTAVRPPVSVLKPLKGDEPLLETALTSFCLQLRPDDQIVFGVQDRGDPAIAVVERLQAAFPDLQLVLIVDQTPHGGNGKIANVINMWPAVRHDVIVLADSDIHAPPDFLDCMAAALAAPGIGVVTSLYAGLAGVPGLVARFGAAHINHVFLPGVLVGRMLGREDCLGAAFAIRRSTLAQIGGFPALLPYLADDAAIGSLVRDLDLKVALAPTLVSTTVGETSAAALFQHELRWARTIRSLAPVSYATSLLQYPVAWALVAMLAADLRPWSVALGATAWLTRGRVMRLTARQLGIDTFSAWLIPLREVLSVMILVTSYLGNRVVWRGRIMEARNLHEPFARSSQQTGPLPQDAGQA